MLNCIVFKTPTKEVINSPPSNDTSVSRWVQRDASTLVGTSDFDMFGAALSLSADGLVLAVGAPYSNGGGVGQDSGSVQIYDYADGNTYIPRGPAINGIALGDTFGWAVSLSNDGEILAVGAPASNGFGYVKIYKYDGEKYDEVIHISESIMYVGELFGFSVSLTGDGKSLAVGMPLAGFGGSVTVYSIDVEAGTSTVTESFRGDSVFNSELGYSVSLSDDGNVLAAVDGYFSQVQVNQVSQYQQVCTMIGEIVAVSGDSTRVAVRNQTSEIVSVFHIDAAREECLQIGQAIPVSSFSPISSDTYASAEILLSLSRDGHVLAVANPLNMTGVQVYKEIYNTTRQLEYVPRGDAIAIMNLSAVSLSDDGSVLAIGVSLRDLGNGQFEDSGSVLVYEWPTQTLSPTSVSSNCKNQTVLIAAIDEAPLSHF